MTNLGKAVPLVRTHVSMQMERPQDGLGEDGLAEAAPVSEKSLRIEG